MIYTTILGSFLQPFPEEVQEAAAGVVAATVDTHNTVRAELLPTPMKSHYTFNLRDVARPSPIPSPCAQFTRAGIEWRRCHRATCMARSYQEHHRSVRAEL